MLSSFVLDGAQPISSFWMFWRGDSFFRTPNWEWQTDATYNLYIWFGKGLWVAGGTAVDCFKKEWSRYKGEMHSWQTLGSWAPILATEARWKLLTWMCGREVCYTDWTRQCEKISGFGYLISWYPDQLAYRPPDKHRTPSREDLVESKTRPTSGDLPAWITAGREFVSKWLMCLKLYHLHDAFGFVKVGFYFSPWTENRSNQTK